MSGDAIQFGIDRLADSGSSWLQDARIGLLMNRASIDSRLRLSCDVVADVFPGQLKALFTPQHGLWGDAQANMIETNHGWHDELSVPIYSLYSETRRPTDKMLADIDCLVVDLQDVGTRVYTYIWTLLECMRACADAGVAIVVLDRPNPIGGEIVEGPLLDEGYFSFVGGATIPMRHGLTIGEMAGLFQSEFSIKVDLHVVPVVGWDVRQTFAEIDRHFIPPSPNLPTVLSALVYPGQVLLEGANLSEGRGTTTPFEMIGAPFVVPERLLDQISQQELPGVRFLPVNFRPTFDKWAGELCGGVSIHVTDVGQFRSYRTTIALIQAIQKLWPADFAWLPPPYEYEIRKPPIDIISGDRHLREGASIDELCQVDCQAWRVRTEEFQLYPRE
ncbi:exo-beta-N-acetylmuramidase NamZ domain-containing protein [Planctomycetes bacterium K23_9]|uniref:DUF1343 domain-containing protein n=1 Tax=Stieleria marina TaxID=1930275 RepID=A0A517NNA7_9BACT|nr:hypothetical protein K239x_05510 [Planctomycetes bacterium K23_9]